MKKKTMKKDSENFPSTTLGEKPQEMSNSPLGTVTLSYFLIARREQ